MHAEADEKIDVKREVAAFKRKMSGRRDTLQRAFAEVKDHITRRAEEIRKDSAAGKNVIPEIAYRDITEGRVSEAARAAVPKDRLRRRPRRVPGGDGERLVRRCRRVPRSEPLRGARGREAEPRQIFLGAEGRQAADLQPLLVEAAGHGAPGRELTKTRAFLDRLWTNFDGVFDPDLQCTYADRVRRRQPGDKTLGLSPHMDAGTVERWIDPGYQSVYANVFAGDWRGYDPFDAKHRLRPAKFPRPPSPVSSAPTRGGPR